MNEFDYKQDFLASTQKQLFNIPASKFYRFLTHSDFYYHLIACLTVLFHVQCTWKNCTYKAGSVLSSYRHHVLSFVWTHWHSLVLEAMLRNMFCPPAPQDVLVFPCFTTLLSSLPCEFKDINMQLTIITILHTLLKASHDWRIGNEEDRRTAAAEAFPNREAINLAHQPSLHLFIDFQ